MKTAIGICIILVSILAATGCNSARQSASTGEKDLGWKMVKTDKQDDPSWSIFTRKIAGTNFLEYKIEGNVESTPQACMAAFRKDLHDQAEAVKNKKYPTYQIVEETEESLLTYVIHNEPFPLKDTEMSVRYNFSKNEDGSTGVEWKEAWDECVVLPSKKLSRVQTFRGALSFSPTSSISSEAVNTVSFDPKKMPMWLVEPMVFKFLKKGLEDIREMTSW